MRSPHEDFLDRALAASNQSAAVEWYVAPDTDVVAITSSTRAITGICPRIAVDPLQQPVVATK